MISPACDASLTLGWSRFRRRTLVRNRADSELQPNQMPKKKARGVGSAGFRFCVMLVSAAYFLANWASKVI